MSNPHYFIGISVSNEIRNQLSQVQHELDVRDFYRRVTHPEDFHCTLSFIGELDDQQLSDLMSKLTQLKFQSMNLHLTSIQGFGTSRPPRVLYVGMEMNDKLLQLEDEISAVTRQFGADRKSPYVPHITLAKRSKGTQDVHFTGEVKGSWEVGNFQLYRIHPGKSPSYEMVSKFLSTGGMT